MAQRYSASLPSRSHSLADFAKHRLRSTGARFPYILQSADKPLMIGPRGYSAEITIEAVTRMLRSLRSIALLMPLLSVPLVAVFWNDVPHRWLFLWWAGAIAVPLAQFLFSRRFLAQPSDLKRAIYFGRLTTLSSVASGLGWGVAGLMLPYAQSVGQQVLLIGLVIGIPSGSIFGCAFWPATQYANSIPAVGLTALGLALQSTPGWGGMAVALLVYLPIVWVLTEQAHGTAIESIRLHFENIDLVKRLEIEKGVAEQANVAKSKFLAAASHDLRQPLHSLGLFLTALNARVEHPDLRELMGNINGSMAALQNLFNALLDISRLDAGAIEVEIRDVSLAPMLARLSREYEPQAQSQGLGWRVSGADVAVRSDAMLLETILRNLISNAVRYTERGEICIDYHVQGAEVAIEVRDTGIGIAPEHHEEIFREFHQLHNPERDRSKGLGLGLAIVDRLVKLLGHSLDVRSSLGGGSIFSLTLPLGSSAAAASETTPIDDAAADAPLHVLVIDDEASVRTAMSLLLGDWGHEVITAASLDEAQRLISRAPDAIVADYRLRDEQTGADAIRAIQARFGIKMPALILTGDTHPDRIAQAKSSGFALLHKPLQTAKLRAFIRAASRARAPPR